MSRKKERFKKSRIRKTPRKTFRLKAEILKDRSEKAHGLIGLTKIYPVYFETRFGIHTFGMKKPIDVFILDNKNRVVKIGKNITPGNIFFWNPKYSKVLELPSNFLSPSISDVIHLLP